MKKLNILLFFILTSSIAFSQIKPGGGISTNNCGSCNDSNNDITSVDSDTFRARYAHAYWWEICNGNATIVGSNKSRNVNISGVNGQTSTIKLTRFYNGNCIESCETFTFTSGSGGTPPCTASVYDIWCNENNGPNSQNYPTLISSQVYLTNPFPNAASGYVRWNASLLDGQQDAGGTFGNLPANASNVLFPSQFYVNISAQTTNWPGGFYVPMQVYYKDKVTGAECTVNLNPLIDEPCGAHQGQQRNINIENEIKIYPNPIKSNQNLKIENIENIIRIEILDMFGKIKKAIKTKTNNIKLDNLDSGIYFIKFYKSDGIEQKKIIIQ